MECMLGQPDDTGIKEHVIYYLSKMLTSCKVKYSVLERTWCTLCSSPKAIHVMSHNLASIKDEYDQVHFLKTWFSWKDCTLEDVFIRVWHFVCYSKNHQGKRTGRIFGSSTLKGFSVNEVLVPKWRYNGPGKRRWTYKQINMDSHISWCFQRFGSWSLSGFDLPKKSIHPFYIKVVHWLHQQHHRVWSVYYGSWGSYWLKS